MKQLNKQQLKARDEISQELELARGNLDSAVTEFNDALEKTSAEVNDELEKYNAVLEKARDWRDEIVGAIDEYVAERSDKWQESEAAQALDSWKSSFDQLELDEVTIELPEAIDDELGLNHEVLCDVEDAA